MGIRQTFKLPDGGQSVAGFKDWAQEIGAALTAVGWQQTSDTGQVNWATFNPSVPFGQNTTQGYEIWKSTDSLSATCPLYVKIYYGVRNNAGGGNNAPAILVGLGFGSDGFGNLLYPFYTGTWGNYNGLGGFNGGSVPTVRVEFDTSWYGSGGSFAMALFARNGYGGTINPLTIWVVERSHDANGNDTDEYVTMWFTSFQTTQFQSWFKPVSLTNNYAGGYGPLVTGTGGFAMPDGTASGAAAGSVAWSPFFPQVGKIGYPSRMLAGFKYPDVGDNQVVQCQLYGTTQNYLTFRQSNHCCAMLPGGSNQQQIGNINVNNSTLAIRWDAGA